MNLSAALWQKRNKLSLDKAIQVSVSMNTKAMQGGIQVERKNRRLKDNASKIP